MNGAYLNKTLATLALTVAVLPLSAKADKTIGNWTVVVDNPAMQVAKTTNDSGSVTGVICLASSNSCSAYLGANIPCEENSKYPMMINAPTGANIATATCVMIAKAPYLLLDDYGAAIAAFESGGEIGFAVPMQSGKFQVLRFSTSGATAAIREARTTKPTTATGTPTQNQTL